MGLFRFLSNHYGAIGLIVGFTMSMVSLMMFMLSGGFAPTYNAIKALSKPEVSRAVQTLPEAKDEFSRVIERLDNRLDEQGRVLQDLSDNIDVYRSRSEDIVIWDEVRSQDLTSNSGPCVQGQVCQIFFVGRRTDAGMTCKLIDMRPKIRVESIGTFPVELSEQASMSSMGTTREAISVSFQMPDFVETGTAAVVLLNVYGECGFSTQNLLQRASFPLRIEIVASE